MVFYEALSCMLSYWIKIRVQNFSFRSRISSSALKFMFRVITQESEIPYVS